MEGAVAFINAFNAYDIIKVLRQALGDRRGEGESQRGIEKKIRRGSEGKQN